ncbi:HNH endonuclease signature motif containing protein [Methylophilus sp. YYY-1]|uniref:HNH endonuclease signature motif containing protein n=1 Tax=Methylophilus sp. YYY-1 TaxID=2682087 RepID=UPI0023B34B95|nr:HNH endonuclease signature motif containing protein [Methylophilus sp. YYY-1]MDF0379024.1 HNH endonuclease [Methylophilus sp. YYY-1]
MSKPTIATVKRLFALSGNQCAFPECNSQLVESTDTITGEICHIKATSPGGARFDKTQSDIERHAASNLVLLCGRHHKIIDSEPEKYTVEFLVRLKRNHEQKGIVEISPITAKLAQSLLSNHMSIIIKSNSGGVEINANTVNFKITKKPKIAINPPLGSIAENRHMLSYAKYLIDRYQEYQKIHASKTDSYKYMAIYGALKREFRGDWKLLPTDSFNQLVTFLQKRIDNTMHGRIQRSRNTKNYHSFEEHV